MFYFYDPTLIMFLWAFLLIGAIGLLVFFILTLVAAMNCLDQCGRRNRDMEPSQVWLALVPAFGLVWSYFVVIRVEEALAREYKSRGLKRPKDFGQPLGLAALICWHGGILLCVIAIGILGYLAAAGLFIPYWQGLMKAHKKLMETRDRRESDRYDEEDDYDDRPRRRSRRDRDDEEDDDRPRRGQSRRERDDDYEDEPPHRRRREDEEDDEPPRRRDAEDDRPKPPPLPPPTPPKPADEGGWKK